MAWEQDTAPAIAAGDLVAPGGAPEAGTGGGAGGGEGAAPSPPPTLPALVGGKYRPIRLIAKGGMGAVYEVVHVNTGEHLALKLMLARSLLTPELRERFRREARIHSAVKSEHVVRVIDADVAHDLDDVPFLVMELLAGRDLERICEERRPSPDEVIDWMRQLAVALDRAHQQGIVHRDLKPENVFLAERDGQRPIIKILDFGVAKTAFETDGHAAATGQILGTPRYMAPEQAVDAKQITAAADRYALGLIAFRLLAGRHYVVGDNWLRLLREVGRGARERPSNMGCDRGPAFDAWFARACAHAPGDRFASSAEAVEALARALDGGGHASRWRRPGVRLAVVSAGVLALAIAAGIVSTGHRPARSAPAEIAARSAAPPPLRAPAALTVEPSPRAIADETLEPIPDAQARFPRAAVEHGRAPHAAPGGGGGGHGRAGGGGHGRAGGGGPRSPDQIWDEP